MKFLKRFKIYENKKEIRKRLIDYRIISYYNLSQDEVNNLTIALKYKYLLRKDYQNVLDGIDTALKYKHLQRKELDYIGGMAQFFESEKLLESAYKTNFKERIIKFPKPYDICFITWGIKNAFAENFFTSW